MVSSSAIAVAKTILHESIHAYLTLKYYGCNQGTTLGIMDDVDISELLNEYHLECAPQQSQHEFMFNFLVPTMSEILTDVEVLIPLTHQQNAEKETFIDENNPTGPEVPWNWQQFYEYLSMSGLHESNAFINSIENTPSKFSNYEKYAFTIGGLFEKDCIDD